MQSLSVFDVNVVSSQTHDPAFKKEASVVNMGKQDAILPNQDFPSTN